jgi:tRNA modification GTPase
VLDRGLALHFPAPHSCTGEDVLELQAHGGPVLLQLLLARCLQALPGRAPGRSPASSPQRAFLNDKLDLAQAEAVADLIEASTEAAARSAGRALAGDFSRRSGGAGARLVTLRTLVEATLDFPEEEIDFLERADARGQLRAMPRRARRACWTARARARCCARACAWCIAGQPNVGKSSPAQRAGRRRARHRRRRFPAPRATASQRIDPGRGRAAARRPTPPACAPTSRPPTRSSASASGAAGARSRAADVVLLLHDLTRAGREAAYDEAEREIGGAAARRRGGDRRVEQGGCGEAPCPTCPARPAPLTCPARPRPAQQPRQPNPPLPATWAARLEQPAVRCACRPARERGWTRCAAPCSSRPAGTRRPRAWPSPAPATCRRCRPQEAICKQPPNTLRPGSAALDLLAEELRLAHRALGEITGEFTSEDLLGDFWRFCIGK